MIKWIQEQSPSQAELFLSSPGTKSLWVQKNLLKFKDDVLYIKEKENFCLVVPYSLRQEIFHLCHDSPIAGHLGIQKTIQRIKRSFMWYNMIRDCTAYVKSCATCNQNKKPARTIRAQLGSYHAGFPMERVHIDILGPFTTSRTVNKYILMMCDQFSKWLECAAIPDQAAETVAQQFLEHFIATFGCSLEIHTDQGSNFQSSLLQPYAEP